MRSIPNIRPIQTTWRRKFISGQILGALCLLLALLSIPYSTNAQSPVESNISEPETGEFPEISTFLWLRGTDGAFVSGLSPGDISILENEAVVEDYSLIEQSPGSQIAIAINPSPTFAVRDSQGITRFDFIAQALMEWVDGQDGSNTDDLTLITTAGTNQAHLSSYEALRTAIRNTPTDYRNAAPNLQTLAQAIDIAGDPPPRRGMGQAVLFITPHIEQGNIPALENLASRANQSGVRIFVWLVTSEAFFQTQGSQALQQMAVDTGGAFFPFSGTEPIPSPETYFEPLRSIYRLTYRSRAGESGEQNLVVDINAGAEGTFSLNQTFELQVLPPNPILVTPPDQIFRALVADENGNYAEDRREPNLQTIEILIEFPDGYERDLQRSTLYVNNQIADENSQPPFDMFDWDLSEIHESGRFSIRVEAVDQLGLSSVSLETPIDITVQRIPEGFVPTIAENSSLLTTIMVVLAGAVLILVLLRIRKLRPQTQPGNGNGRLNGNPSSDPVYQPVRGVEKPSRRLTRWTSRLHWPQQQAPRSEPYAFLERIVTPGSIEPVDDGSPLGIHTTEVTLGTDPEQSTILIEDPSVAGLHARIRKTEDGRFTINDYDTISGTWVNYLPINGNGNRIEHGDLLHFGRVGFRFTLPDHPNRISPKIEKEYILG